MIVKINKQIAEIISANGYNISLRLDFAKEIEAHFQSSSCLAHPNSYDLAVQLSQILEQDKKIFAKVYVSGSGYLNFVFHDSYLLSQLSYKDSTDTLLSSFKDQDVDKINRTVIIDFGGMNVGKEPHIGHFRSLMIGSCLAKAYQSLGYKVITDIHLGDYGLNVGIMLTYMLDNKISQVYPKLYQDSVAYVQEYNLRDQAKNVTVKLQNKIEPVYSLYLSIIEQSKSHFKDLLSLLDINFDLWWGESDTQSILAKNINLWIDQGKCYKNLDGAVFTSDQEWALVNSHGGYLYSATDLGTIIKREEHYQPYKIIYVVDHRQQEHMNHVFHYAKSWQLSGAKMVFIGFGTVNGLDGKPYKSRSGENITMAELINITKEQVRSENTEDKHIICMATLKFATLMHQCSSGYKFNIEQAIKPEGKTGVYILYTIARINSLLNKVVHIHADKNPIKIYPPLIACLIYKDQVLQDTVENHNPALLCDYLYNLAYNFNSFYGQVKFVSTLGSIHPIYHQICMQSLSTLKKYLSILGIQSVQTI